MIKDENDYLVVSCDRCAKISWAKRNGRSFKATLHQLMAEGWRPERINGEWRHYCGRECYLNDLPGLRKA